MLNPKQEKFARNMAKGMTQVDAYKDAYNAKYSVNAIYNKASDLFKKEEVQERYKELRDKMMEKDVLSAVERMKFLSDVVKSEKEEADLNVKIKAVDTLNKMTGEYTQKVELTDSKLEVTVRIID